MYFPQFNQHYAIMICFRPNVEELKNHLKDLGANFVVTEENLKSPEMKDTMKVSLVLYHLQLEIILLHHTDNTF